LKKSVFGLIIINIVPIFEKESKQENFLFANAAS